MKHNRPWRKPWYVQRSEENNPRKDLGTIVESTPTDNDYSADKGNGFLGYAARVARKIFSYRPVQYATLGGLASIVMLTSASCSGNATPTPQPTPNIPTQNGTPNISPEPAPEPIPITKPFELVGDNLTAEQYKTFYDNSLEDYLKVLEVYGIKKEDARMVINVGVTQYSADFYFGGKVGTGAEMGHNNFTTDRRGMRHSIGHAINDTLFPTYHSWFDEGLAMYASGEVETAKTGLVALRETDGSLKSHKWDEAINLLVSNPNEFWNRLSAGLPGHTIGLFLYELLEREGLTPEKNREALDMLANTYKATGTQPAKMTIQAAYESALGKNLDPLFELLKPGVMLLYSTDPDVAGTVGYKINQKIRSEF